jgi:hypothetical protein
MTIENVESLANKIAFLEKKINKIEVLLHFLIEDEDLTEEEKKLLEQADEIVNNDRFDELVRVK